ncbi:lysosome-associated membrane glycoprotein 1-like [Microplitis mediator]|uniref:lysosome-associated membrane glycoprotein 1-like n=1 Tax=Microplitis mediator TaxID=375433 RepID=UPI0025557CA8|nr:lysosome-associated membrane glycoprotein 1-like [Microplitis mediator]
MKFSMIICVCWLVISVSGQPADKIDSTKNVVRTSDTYPPEPAPDTNNTTTVKPTPEPTPPGPEPTPPGPEPTPTPNTTTTEPTTTTTAKTTTTTTTLAPNTTTSTTTTTTATPPTPAPTPGPAPAPKSGKWIVNGTNHTCIVVKMAAQFNVTYLNKDNKNVSQLITLPSDNMTTNASGDCGANEQFIMISWNSTVAFNDSLVLHFNKNGTKYSLHHIETYLAPAELPNYQYSTTLMLMHNTSEYPIAVSNSYRCAKAVKLNLNSNVPNTTAVLEISDLQFQAFRSDNTTTFGFAEDCAFETQDVVPIAVGCALIALVIIVLAAYLVGRRRSQARGYRSM